MSVPTFKDLAKRDIYGVFIHLDEFAETHTVDGKAMHIVIDNNELLEREAARGGQDVHNDGTYTAHLLIYVPMKEYGPRPKLGKRLDLDGKRMYTIVDCIDEDGIYSMELEAVRV